MNDTGYIYKGKWALITGASSGIGKAFAYELASRGANLILCSRSEATLREIARDIGDRFQVEVDVIAVDLAVPNAPEELFSKVKGVEQNGAGSYQQCGFWKLWPAPREFP
jgi:uncharacterized protein